MYVISENRQAMLKICDDLVSGEVTREEILEHTTTEVDSTTDTEASPVKRVKVAKKSAQKSNHKTKGKSKACVEAAKSRAKAIFDAVSSPHHNSSSTDLASDTSTAELKELLALQHQQIENLQRQLQKTCM